MQNSSKAYRHQFTKQRRKAGSIRITHDIFSSKPLRPAISHVVIVPAKKSRTTWNGRSSLESLTKQLIMDHAHSHFICLESLSSILTSGKLSATSRKKIAATLSSLRQTERSLKGLLRSLLAHQLIKSYGAGDQRQSSRPSSRKG